uniref:Uncharacterized protein n=1 Tax=Manihot esculenta TaxID=3983 RepID=A0A2C9VWV0_MANES
MPSLVHCSLPHPSERRLFLIHLICRFLPSSFWRQSKSETCGS